MVDVLKWRAAARILTRICLNLFRVDKITFSLTFKFAVVGNVRSLANGLNNEFSHRVGPITTNWDRVSCDKPEEVSLDLAKIIIKKTYHWHLPSLWRSNCEFLKSFCSSIVLFAGTTKSLSSRAKRQRQMLVLISREVGNKSQVDWLCKVGKLSGTPYICACGSRLDTKPVVHVDICHGE